MHSLTRDEILDMALRIADDEGLERLTMRRLGAALGVDPMLIYRHVPNKEALLDMTVERMRSEMRLAKPLPEDPAALFEAIFVEYRRLLMAHPNLLPLAARRADTAAVSGLEFLVGQGLDLGIAVELYQSLLAFTIGFSILASPDVAADWRSHPAEFAGRLAEWRDDTFRRTLRSVIDEYGLAHRKEA